jgi:chemotaxis protein methyltransferase CheR
VPSEIRRLAPEEHLLLNELIEAHFGISYAEGKRDLLEARLRPRLAALGLRRFIDYYLLLKYDFEPEAPHLARLLTNNESYFFRETYQFESLMEDGLARLASSRPRPHAWRFLCAGCSSGEEAYTLAIFARASGVVGCTIDAFDLDADRVAVARGGRYQPNSLRALDDEAVGRYFRPAVDDLHELRPALRQGVEFAWGNILDPTTFGRSAPHDAIFCRNVLIYFSERALLEAIHNFGRLLCPGGFLFLGHSESIIGVTQRFETVRLGRCIAYRKADGE